jgi:hypothetical protein
MFEIIGAYKYPRPTRSHLVDSAKYYGYGSLVNAKNEYAEPISWENMKYLGLVEARASRGFSIDDVSYTVMDTEQAPYLEYYLHAEEDELIWDPSAKIGSADSLPKEFRVCFVLHFLHPDLGSVFRRPTIRCRDSEHVLMRVLSMPSQLKALTHYVPVD